MTAAVPETARSAAPQAMSEQLTAPMEIIQKREMWRFWMLVFGFGILTSLVAMALFVHQVIQFGEGRPVGLARVLTVVSLGLRLAVIICGRWIAYR